MAPGTDPNADREIIITRIFDAPPELVWRAWTDPEQITQWWGPNGFTTTTYHMDVRVGGEWRFDFHGPDGRLYPNRIVYDDIEAPNRIVYSHREVEGADYDPVTFQSFVTFERRGEQTNLTMRMVFPTSDERDRVVREFGAVDGGIQTVNRLATHLAGRTGAVRPVLTIALPTSRELVMVRAFNAPPLFVWEANTKPELFRQWLSGPPGWAWAECENDFRVGGRFRWSWRGPDDALIAMHGEYREIESPHRIVRTESFDMGCGPQAGEQLATLSLVERDGGTIVKVSLLFPSMEARDGAIASGMEHGVSAGYDRLDAMYAATL